VAKKHGYRTEENFPGSEFTPDEWEFLRAMRDYQTKHNRRYPTYREVFEVLLSLGYRKVPPTEDQRRTADASKT
jgi:hypothetical protein